MYIERKHLKIVKSVFRVLSLKTSLCPTKWNSPRMAIEPRLWSQQVQEVFVFLVSPAPHLSSLISSHQMPVPRRTTSIPEKGQETLKIVWSLLRSPLKCYVQMLYQ